jgi:hypothetical protein
MIVRAAFLFWCASVFAGMAGANPTAESSLVGAWKCTMQQPSSAHAIKELSYIEHLNLRPDQTFDIRVELNADAEQGRYGQGQYALISSGSGAWARANGEFSLQYGEFEVLTLHKNGIEASNSEKESLRQHVLNLVDRYTLEQVSSSSFQRWNANGNFKCERVSHDQVS